MLDARDDIQVELRGCVLQVAREFLTYDGPPTIRALMIEGPRGTGKSRGILQVIYALCDAYPGIRVLLCRNKRHSMSGTTLSEFEKCFSPDEPAREGPKPEGRSVYRFANGTEVYCAGIDESDRLRSFTVDLIYYEEGTESDTPEAWESLLGALRNWKLPFQAIITTVNPKNPGHWLNKRANEGRIERFKSVFADNPMLFSAADGDFTPEGRAFIANLKNLTGHRYRRDYLGEWCAAEGVVFDEYDPAIHEIDAEILRPYAGGHEIKSSAFASNVPVDWYGISMDFGYRAPGVLQVWAANDERQMLFRVAEVYQPGKQLDWWADAIVSLHSEFPFDRGVADSAEPRTIDFINDRCSMFGRRSGTRFLRKADKSAGKIWGLDQVRWGLTTANGGPRTYLVKGATRYGRCAELEQKGKPCSLEEEIPNLVWRRVEGQRGIEKDEPDPGCADHAIDAATYMHVFAWKKKFGKSRSAPQFKPGTYGSILKYQGEPIQWPKYAS